MVLDVDKAVSRYKQLLKHYLNSTKRIQWKRTAQELECLARYAIDNSDRITVEFFEGQLYEVLGPHNFDSYISLDHYNDFVTLYNGLFCKLHYLKGHISDKWLKSCKVKYLSLAMSALPRLLNRCCDEYIFKDENCLHDVTCIFECIRYYESSLELKAENPPGKLTGFDKELLSRVVKWVSKYEMDFGRIYVIWKKTEEILKLCSSNGSLDSPAFQLFSGDRHQLVPKTLENYILSPDTVFSVYGRGGYNVTYDFDNHDAKYYYSNKGLRWEHNFDLLLRGVILVDDFHCTRLHKRNTLKREFEESLDDIGEFHVELFNYVQEKFQSNYHAIRKDPHKTLSRLEGIWINALSTFLIHYLTSLDDFLHLILRKLIFPQVLVLCGKFKPFYQHNACLERHVFDNVCKTIPRSVLEFKEAIDWIVNSPIDSDRVNANGPIIDNVFMSRPISEQFNLSSEREPIWPNQDFRDYWNEQVAFYSSKRKTLHGCFSSHLISMKLPIPSSNATRITLITNLSIASILTLYNDYTRLKIDGIRMKLAIDKSKEPILQENLKKLLNFGLIYLSKDNFYEFNYNLKRVSSSEKFLKLV
ncbi:hypothetical protein ZYGR_0AG03790 [Zygosaccharomyces rouxii]|uniref:Cullin family profile domain-containing protein n=1 Tax=Zygosaccharomyces rouxii TaxID=4956 RepID=A0A1Q3A9S2_ZYGRO|nr:hypothetical protein ZYGR_0AG03790 [Zygosaccharomyces rouxii]